MISTCPEAVNHVRCYSVSPNTNTDAIRRQAHRVASSPGAGTTYNPFSRVRSRETAIPQDAEAPPARSLSETQMNSGNEHDRALQSAQAEKEFGGPAHASTEPSPVSGRNSLNSDPTATTDFAPSGSAAHKKASADISDKTAVNNAAETQTNGSVVKQRGWVKKIIHGSKKDEDSDADEDRHESEKLDVEERRRRSLKRKIPIGQQIRYVIFGAWINVLLIMVPVGFAVNYTHKLNAIGVFLINFVAIIPLAAMLSNATEELALRVGETLGGLLNASFGYVVLHSGALRLKLTFSVTLSNSSSRSRLWSRMRSPLLRHLLSAVSSPTCCLS